MNVSRLLDDYIIRVLSATSLQALSTDQLNRGLAIPIASIYRIVRELTDAGFLSITSTEKGRNGHDTKFYRSTIKNVRVKMENGKVTAQVEMASGVVLTEGA